MKRHRITCLGLLVCLLSVLASTAPALLAAEPVVDTKEEWVAIFPGTGGVAVDRSNGDVYIVNTGTEIFKEPSQGIWKSTNRGNSFARVDGGVIGGRCETGYALCPDPKGQRLYCFMLDGPSGFTLDAGKHWERLGQVNRGWDFAAVDWSVEKPLVILGFEHENGGKYHLSSDGGKKWTKLGEFPAYQQGFDFGVGVIDATALVRWMGTNGGIELSRDSGVTWKKVSAETPVSHVMVVLEGVCYWLGAQGLIVSRDKGTTWTVQGQPVAAAWGPYFGKNSRHIVAAGKTGVHETLDGGHTWSLITALPEPFRKPPGPGWYLNFAFDPVGNIFYASWMGKPTYRYRR